MKIQSKALEILAVQHCNLSCASCDHLSPISARHEESITSLLDSLGALSEVYHAQTLRVLGGEPTLRSNLSELLRGIRETGIANTVRIISNGTLLDRFTDEILSLIDSVELSLYPGFELSKDQILPFKEKCRKHNVRLFGRITKFFRVSHSEIGTTDSKLVADIYKTCKIAHERNCQTLNEGVFFLCSRASTLDRELLKDPAFQSGVNIFPKENLFNRLEKYLNSREAPLNACKYCLGVSGKLIPHSQIPRSQWRSMMQVPTEELLDRAALDLGLGGAPVDMACVTPPETMEHLAIDQGYDGSPHLGNL